MGQHVHPDDLDVYMEDIGGVSSGKKKYHDCQYRARNASGEYVWVECKGNVIRDAEGNPIIFEGFMTRIDGQSKYDSLTGLLTTHEMHHFDFATQSGIAFLVGMDGFLVIAFAFNLQEVTDFYGKLCRETDSMKLEDGRKVGISMLAGGAFSLKMRIRGKFLSINRNIH